MFSTHMGPLQKLIFEITFFDLMSYRKFSGGICIVKKNNDREHTFTSVSRRARSTEGPGRLRKASKLFRQREGRGLGSGQV